MFTPILYRVGERRVPPDVSGLAERSLLRSTRPMVKAPIETVRPSVTLPPSPRPISRPTSARPATTQSLRPSTVQSPRLSTSPPPSPTRASKLRNQFATYRPWPRETATPSWAFDEPSPRSKGAYGAKDWARLSKPRDGYSRDDAIGPAKKTAAAVWERTQFLREKGYIDNPKELLRMRFHGTSAEKSRAQNSARASAQSEAATAEMSVAQQTAMLRNCWRTGRPIPEWLQQNLEPPEDDLPRPRRAPSAGGGW